VEKRANGFRDSRAIVLELPPGEAEDVKAKEPQAGVAGPVVLEGGSGPVGLPAVDLGDQALAPPEKVDDESIDACIHFRLRKPAETNQRQKSRFQLAAGLIRNEVMADRQSEVLGLPEGRRENRSGESGPEILDGAGGVGDWNAAPEGAVPR
jgi:hypothetical protein